jgi:hypothetical protein
MITSVQSTIEYTLSMPMCPLVEIVARERSGRRRQRRVRDRPRPKVVLRIDLELPRDLLLHRSRMIHIVGRRGRHRLGVARVPADMRKRERIGRSYRCDGTERRQLVLIVT